MVYGSTLPAALFATALLTGPVAAQIAAPPTPPIEAPRDAPFAGVIALKVDATDLAHGIFTVHETLPLDGHGGPITLLYPKWIPGHHSPSGTIDKLGGLTVTAGREKLRWRRDPVEVTAFHVDPPPGVTALDIDFQYLSAVSTKEGHVDMTPVMLDLDWNSVVLYPAGHYARNITVAPSVVLPSGFTAATALEPAGGPGAYKPVTLETLIDSPVMAGRYFKVYDLDTSGKSPVRLDVMADRPVLLDAKPVEIDAHRDLVVQADRLFGARHFAHYDFLLWLSDKLGGAGLEHHQSSEDGTYPTYFQAWDTSPAGRDLLAHEYTHSWNGKFRRPADLWTPNFEVPMRGSLLWVYEGQTQYWGYVLSARSGLLSHQETLDALALTAATYDQRVGRSWRPLEDTTNDPVIANRRPLSWPSWQRSEDYYSEGEMIWLDADTLIRERSGGRRSLDDFAGRFFGIDDGSTTTVTYTFDDVVAALNAVQPYDWATFLKTRLESNGPGAPLGGLARGGYRLVFRDVETDYQKSVEARRKVLDLSFGIGLTINKDDGVLTSVDWDMPGFKAGLAADTQIIAVNGDAYDADRLKDAIRAAAPITLLIKSNAQYRTITVDYRGGLRYPRLERIAGTADRLSDILATKGR